MSKSLNEGICMQQSFDARWNGECRDVAVQVDETSKFRGEVTSMNFGRSFVAYGRSR
jgi:hypothetical protein